MSLPAYIRTVRVGNYANYLETTKKRFENASYVSISNVCFMELNQTRYIFITLMVRPALLTGLFSLRLVGPTFNFQLRCCTWTCFDWLPGSQVCLKRYSLWLSQSVMLGYSRKTRTRTWQKTSMSGVQVTSFRLNAEYNKHAAGCPHTSWR